MEIWMSSFAPKEVMHIRRLQGAWRAKKGRANFFDIREVIARAANL
jgi:hypothetical protein